MTRRQQEEIAFLLAFKPCLVRQEEIEEFVRYTTHGGAIPKDNPLVQAKRWFTVTVALWKEMLAEQTLFFFELEEDWKEFPYALRVIKQLKDGKL